ncbi:unnamed protein product, partial [Polarella glacialis]
QHRPFRQQVGGFAHLGLLALFVCLLLFVVLLSEEELSFFSRGAASSSPKNTGQMGPKSRVYLDIAIGNRTGGRVIIELFSDVTPRTAENFRGLCTGEYGSGKTTKKKLSYEGCDIFRSVKGFMLQTGDFQFNNGDGGESIYGGKFNDEDFSRRHTQAGIVSMANNGRNSNGSQFFITLKRSQQLDNKHIAFGQVVEGMDVIRACAQVPTDRDERPRVQCKIVGCGEVGKAVHSHSLATQMSEQIEEMQEEMVPKEKVNAAAAGRAILAGKQGGAAVDEESTKGRRSNDKEDEEQAIGGTGVAPARNERERKLLELRLKMNAGRNANSKEVVEEQKRDTDPAYAKKQAEQRFKRKQEKEENPDGEDDGISEKKKKPGSVPNGKDYLLDTIETHENQTAKHKKGNPDAFGWDIFNQDSLYRAHEKRVLKIKFDEEGYKARMAEAEGQEEGLAFAGFAFKATEQ